MTPGANPAARINSALSDLGRRGLTSLFLEGGKTLAVAFAAADQLDESRTFVAPMLLSKKSEVRLAGDPEGDSENEHFARRSPPPGRSLRPPLFSSTELVGEDTLITNRFKEW